MLKLVTEVKLVSKEGYIVIGLPKGEVFLIPWTEQWNKEFIKEEELINGEIGKIILRIHHIGSTAVKYLSAKPIIDIAIEIRDINDGLLCVSGLERLGYSYKGTNILPERHYFNKGEPRTHQIHMFQIGNEYLKKQLMFRDYLIENKQARQQYQQLKETLSKKHNTNKLAYTDAKTEFINAILSNAIPGRQ